jgi:8-oxo-dGTP diphosphatase
LSLFFFALRLTPNIAFALARFGDMLAHVKHQVSKAIVVAALITDIDDRVLVVKPSHKDGWIFPGGYVEVGESPSGAFQREINAEIGIDLAEPPRLLSIDYRGSADEYVMFIFDGGVFTEEMKGNIKLSPGLLEFRFVSPEEAMSILRANSARRLGPTLAARNKTGIAYLEHQELL